MTTKPSKHQQAPRRPRLITPELVRDALAHIPPDVDRETWARLAMAIKSELSDAVAFGVWNDWSATGDTYDERSARDTWRSVKAGGATTIATLFGIAKDHGYRFPKAERNAAAQTPEQIAAAASEAERMAEQRRCQAEADAAELLARHERAAELCEAMWNGAAETMPKAGCPYLKRKGVQAHGLRFLGGVALVPMRDIDGRLWSVQRLLARKLRDPKTGKDTTDKLYGPTKPTTDEKLSSRKTGLFHVIGQLDGAELALMAEGFATCATLHEATGRPVVVCFDSGNLVHVAGLLRQRWPRLPLLVCGDDDQASEAKGRPNAGRLKAKAAATVAGAAAGLAAVLMPTALPEGGSDFNDIGAQAGLQAVAAQVHAAAAELLAASAQQGGAASGTGAPIGPVDDARHQGAAERPASGVVLRVVQGGKADESHPTAADGGNGGAGGGRSNGSGGGGHDGGTTGPAKRDAFTVNSEGVWFSARDNEGNDKPPIWLCSRLDVDAQTRADDMNGWGYLLRFTDPDDNAKTWAMPSSMLSGEGAEWASRLRDMGLRMAPGTRCRNLVAQYIDTRNPTERVTCTDRVGWHGSVYVLPTGCIGQAEGRRYVFQSESGMENTFRRQGELADWRREVAALCIGNSRLVFAVSCALAGPVLRPSGLESGGFNFRADSRAGKTTGLLCAASVWGRPSFMQRWRTTSNALESMAVQHGDGTLILDEFGQLDPREAGDVAYLLSNGQEKGRATRSGLARKRRTWQLLFLSSGEVGLADQMAEAGKRARAGQEVRMVDVPLDAGAGMGGLEDCHSFDSPAELAEAVVSRAARSYGTAGRAWLEWCAAHFADLPELLQELIERCRGEFVPDAASGQVRTVGSRFALVAAAGELATKAGITGWPAGEATRGARRCFEAWLGARGHMDNGEEAAMLGQVRAFLERNGEALFTWTHRAMDDHKPNTPLRAGFKRMVDEQGDPLKTDAAATYLEQRSAPESSERNAALVEFLILPEAFRREVCRSFDPTAVARVLQKHGHLKHERDRLMDKQRLPGMGKASCYRVLPSIFLDRLG